mmetsp:Transcript_46250/g.118078  ORF Transcript_46250/g.118078 Transcript_46250/m.118078 type:complete len:282 (-) Transcript_46250:324-1169(-)|eukprot:jgi/Tetstr1/462590/TSEL_007576.t1
MAGLRLPGQLPTSIVSEQDVPIILGLAVAYPFLRYLLSCLVFERLGRRVVGPRAGAQLPDKVKLRLGKFSESFWKLVVYSSFVALGLRAVLREPWLDDCGHFWAAYPSQAHSPELLQYYWLEMAFYISSQFMLVCWETRRSDFYAMFIHHCATNSLIMFSYHKSCLRIGSVIMLLHDISDVFLEGAKLCKYAAREAAADGLFGAFMLSWAVLRLYYFPVVIVQHVVTESLQHLGDEASYYTFSLLLCTLVVLHVYWFWLILRVAVNKLVTGKVDDVREEDD